MYSPIVVARNLDEFAAREGWMPVYHSLEQVEAFKAKINEITKLESNSKSSTVSLVRSITQRDKNLISRWIINEQVLCGLSFDYWASNYAWVCDEEGRIFKYQPRMSQKVYDIIVSDFDEQGVSTELLILKGRQLGVTTATALKFIHRMLFVPHTQAIMASVKATASQLIARILDTVYNQCPWWLVPVKLPKGQFDNGSVLSIQSGMQATGLAQGWTPTCLIGESSVRVKDGFTKRIKDIMAGDQIITHSGSLDAVKTVRKTRGEDHSKKIKLWGYYEPFECTVDHRVRTPMGWEEAAELSVGDYVCHPIRKITSNLTTATMQRLRRGKVEVRRLENVSYELNEELGYLCGFYLAEGTIHESALGHKTKSPYISEVMFAVHNKEITHRIEQLRRVVGEDQNIRVNPEKENGSRISMTCAWLARWLAENFGRVKLKHVPDWVFNAGEEFCHGLVHGYFDGDATYETGTNCVRTRTVCKQVAIQVRDLVSSLGFGWSSVYFSEARYMEEYKLHKSDTWELVLSGPTGYAYRIRHGLPTQKMRNGKARHWRYLSDRHSICIMIESVEDSYASEFYDIEIDHDDHSFVLDQCAVHNCAHLSELADIPDPQKTIEEGLFRAMHTSPNLFLVLEGTGGGNTGWLADTWRSAKKNWPLGMSRLCPVFISWPMCPEIYPKEGWLKKFPVPGDFLERRLESTAKHVAKCEAYIRNTPYLAKVMGRDYIMPFEQQWFYEFNYRQACENHTQKTWQSQMPADDFEALTGEHDPVFDLEVIDGIEGLIYEIQGNDKTRKIPVQAYAITGHDVDDAFYPREDQIDDSEPIIEISWNSNRGQTYEWQLVPLLPLSEDEEVNTMDRLLVYEPPKRGSMYTCGIDTADGLGQEDEDRTVLSLSKNLFDGDSDRQACELTSNRLNAAQAVAFAACIGAWYGPACRDSRGVRFAIEQIGRPGETCQHQLKMMGFSWHYIPKRFDQKKIKADIGGKEGWWSSSWSVSILMTRFVEAVNGGWYVPKSRWLIEELRTLERHTKTGKSKMEHRAGQHDDRVRAAAQSYFCAHDMDILAERAQKKHAGPPKKNDNRPRPKAGDVGIGSWDD